MKVDVWFSKKIHFVGEHGEIDVEIYSYPELEGGGVDKERLVLKETFTVANLKQAIRRAMPFTSPNKVLVEWEHMVAIIELQNKILKNFTEQFYTVYVRDYGKEKLEICEPRDRDAKIEMPNRGTANIVSSGTDMGGGKPVKQKKSMAVIKPVRKVA